MDVIDIENQQFKFGQLVICPTPIGNLKDISIRQYEALFKSDVIACEDTRSTGMLLKLLKQKKINQDIADILGVQTDSAEGEFLLDQNKNLDEEDILQDQMLQMEQDQSIFDQKEKQENGGQRQQNPDPNQPTTSTPQRLPREEYLQQQTKQLREKAKQLLFENDSLNIFDNNLDEKTDIAMKNLKDRMNSIKERENQDRAFYRGQDENSKSQTQEQQDRNEAEKEYDKQDIQRLNIGYQDEYLSFLREKVQNNRHFKGRGVLISNHKFNQENRLQRIIQIIKYGFQVCLVSDAGTPTISDPGHQLVQRCYKEGIQVTGLPGSSAVTTALCVSGFPADQFEFLGYFSQTISEREDKLKMAQKYGRTAVFFESANRLSKTLISIEKIFGQEQQIFIILEISKLHEQFFRGKVKKIYENINDQETIKQSFLKGECTIVLAPFNSQYNQGIKHEEQLNKVDQDNQEKEQIYQISQTDFIDKTVEILSQNQSVKDKEILDIIQSAIGKDIQKNEIMKVVEQYKHNNQPDFQQLIS